MKKLVCMLLLIQSGFVMAQKETFVTINGKKVQMDPNSLNTADNGLTANAGNVQLGGALLKPTTLTTTAANTLTIGGLQTGASTDNVLVADANGVLKWVTRASLGDNLGNHTATTTLNMSNNSISNIHDAIFKDRDGNNAITYSIYKDTGNFGVYNGSKLGNDLTINETTRKTTLYNMAISLSTDGTAPAAGYVATSADASGNVVWKAASALGVAGDNLGNHIATQDLDMSSKNINNINTAKIKYEAVISDRGNTALKDFTLFKSNGVFNIWNATKSSYPLKIDENSDKTSVTALAIAKGTDGAAPAAGYVATSADASGNVVWKSASSLTVTGDNLGNHTATQDLEMSNKNIKDIFNGYIKNDLQIFDRTSSNTDYFSLYKNNGIFSIYNRSKLSNDLTINEANRRTTINNLAIQAGTDGSVPAAGSVAVSADASGNVVWKAVSALGAGDNLGNHTATTNLNMSIKNINNIYNADIKNTLQIFDRVPENTNVFGLYKNNGTFGIYNNSKAGNDLTIDEVTRKTGVNNLSIYRGTDGSVPAAGLVAVSADGSGNVVWKAASALGAGDNLGNHTATQDLEMSSKNINNINTAKIKYEAVISDRGNTALKDFTMYKSNGVFNIWNATKNSNSLRIDENSDKTSVTALAIAKGTDGAAPAAGYIATSADGSGNVVWKAPAVSSVMGVKTISTNYTVLDSDYTIIASKLTGDITVTLPAAASSTGRVLVIAQNNVSNAAGAEVTVKFNVPVVYSDTFSASEITAPYYSATGGTLKITLQSDQTNWRVVSSL
ncbi:hypothetical protein [Flavobacterium sp. UBA7680]|uniref:hypothetical protein n=1 Tax=Flavobacterium sp. UBA7680 TaxID=1946559 RepID=UPI0025B85872|nr:hypothetical protein [Flavobacterium sp. UBA7680]